MDNQTELLDLLRSIAAPLIVRRLTGVDASLQLRPDVCAAAWKACWPNEEGVCP